MPASASELGSGTCTTELATPKIEPEGVAEIVSLTQIVWMGGRLTLDPVLELINDNDHVPEPGAVPDANAANVSKISFTISVVVPDAITSSAIDWKYCVLFVISSS